MLLFYIFFYCPYLIIFIYYYYYLISHILSYSPFIIFIIIILYHILYIPHLLLSSSFIILILRHLYPLLSSFTTLVLYHPPLLSASLLISSFILYTPLMRINPINIAIVQDVSGTRVAAGIAPGPFHPIFSGEPGRRATPRHQAKFWGRANSRKDPLNKKLSKIEQQIFPKIFH